MALIFTREGEPNNSGSIWRFLFFTRTIVPLAIADLTISGDKPSRIAAFCISSEINPYLACYTLVMNKKLSVFECE